MSKLIDIAKKYTADQSKNFFIETYCKYFESYVDKKFNLLEIGIAHGDSLRIYRDYFKNANICGLDIDEKKFIIDGVEFFSGDQSNTRDLKKITNKYENFDIIIDDGSHVNSHIISSFKFLFPYLNNNGLYIIEDLQTSYFPRYGGSRLNLKKKNTSMNFLKSLTDEINYEGFNKPFYKKTSYAGKISNISFFQNCVIIKKGDSKKFYYNKADNNYTDKIKKFISKFF